MLTNFLFLTIICVREGVNNMKKTALIFLLFSALILSSCAFYWDSEFGAPPYSARIIFRVDPMDARILLDGRFIGEAVEFSTPETALRLRSRNHEIIIKKKGYVEEAIDLRKFSTRDIDIELTMKEEKRLSAASQKPEVPAEGKKPEYIAKTAPVIEPEVESGPEKPIVARMVKINFEILPAEAAIYVNGKFWGIAPEGGKIQNQFLKAGTTTIEVVKPGFKSVKKVIELKDQKQLTVTITLEKKEQDETVVL
jgi:hypothetical protein